MLRSVSRLSSCAPTAREFAGIGSQAGEHRHAAIDSAAIETRTRDRRFPLRQSEMASRGPLSRWPLDSCSGRSGRRKHLLLWSRGRWCVAQRQWRNGLDAAVRLPAYGFGGRDGHLRIQSQRYLCWHRPPEKNVAEEFALEQEQVSGLNRFLSDRGIMLLQPAAENEEHHR
jgi:hypothetical protein